MPKYRRPPLTVAELWQDGPPCRLRDLAAASGLSLDTIYQDIEDGTLHATKRSGPTSPYRVDRSHARQWLTQMGVRKVDALVPTVLPAGTYGNLQPTPYPITPAVLHAVLELMGLGSIVRSAYRTAHQVTGGTDGLQVDVAHYAWTSQDGYGKPTYASAKTYPAIVTRTQRLIRTQTGHEVMSRASLEFLQLPKANGASNRTEPIDTRDKLVLPDGTTGPILDVNGLLDPTTEHPFGVTVWIG